MQDSVKINLVKTEQEWQEVNEYGITFDHELLPEHRQWPLFAVRDLEGKLVGFYFIKTLPMSFGAWGPNMNARQFVETMKTIRSWNKMQSQLEATEQGYAVVNLENPKFTPQVMDKLGFNRVGLELYQAKE